MIEKEIQLCYFFKIPFIWSNFSFYILMISLWFITKASFGFCHWLLLKLSRVRGKRNKKAWFCDNCFHFQIFWTFGNLDIDFRINLKTFFWIVAYSYGVKLLFSERCDALQNRFETCRYNAGTPSILCDMYLQLQKISLFHKKGILSYMRLKRSYFMNSFSLSLQSSSIIYEGTVTLYFVLQMLELEFYVSR